MPESDLSDAEILKRIAGLINPDHSLQTGYEYYFEILFHRYYKQGLALAHYYGLSREDALDVVQESFAKIYRKINRISRLDPFKPYYFKMLMNLVHDKYREINKHKTVDFDAVLETPVESINNTGNIFEKLQNEDYINRLILRLTPKLRQVLLLKIKCNLEPPEIAEAAGIQIRQVYNRLNKALDLIQKMMENDVEK